MENQGQNFEENDRLEYNLDNKLNPELDRFLEDKKLNGGEAKALTEIFDANKVGILDVSKENLADLRVPIESKSKRSYITGTEKKKIKEIGEEEFIKEKPITAEEIVEQVIENHHTDEDIIEKVTKETVQKEATVTIEEEKKYTKNDIIKEAKEFGDRIIKLLQFMLGFSIGKGVDGDFGGKTFKKYSLKNPNWAKQNLKSFINENIKELEKFSNLLGNPKLSGKKEYKTKYGELSTKLGESLNLPKGLIDSIVKKESSYGENLNSETGSKGIMQLTIWPFNDMKGDETKFNKDGVPYRTRESDLKKVERYRNIFKKLDLADIKSIDMGDGKKIESTLSDDIWEKLEKLQNDDISTIEAQQILKEFKKLIKSPNHKFMYFHTLNMIIGSVYFSMLYSNTQGKTKDRIIKAAERYNGDKDHKEVYAKKVYSYYAGGKS